VREEPINPDLAGWRRERLPVLPEKAYFDLAPDWVCEVLSPSTEEIDREEKMPIYAVHGVLHVWLIDPVARTLEVYALGAKRRWSAPAVHRDDARVRVAPFDAIELELSALWAPAASP
jgi:Uma2 family endonuclease